MILRITALAAVAFAAGNWAAPVLAADEINLGPGLTQAGAPLAVIDCYGILNDEMIRRYFELGCEVKGLGRGHIQRIKKDVVR